MPKKEIDYAKSIIYKLCCKDVEITDIYIGSTTNFTNRKRQHKCNCNNPNSKDFKCYVYEFIRSNGGWENWQMIPVECYSCENKNELLIRERYWLETLNAKLNIIKQVGIINELGQVEYKTKYYEENREELKQYQTKYYEENKEELKEKNKNYRQENKEEIKQYQKKYNEEHKEEIKQYQTNYRQENKQYQTKYYNENKDLIKEKNKKFYEEKRKIKFTCECGKTLTICKKAQHIRTKYHQNFINNKEEIK